MSEQDADEAVAIVQQWAQTWIPARGDHFKKSMVRSIAQGRFADAWSDYLTGLQDEAISVALHLGVPANSNGGIVERFMFERDLDRYIDQHVETLSLDTRNTLTICSTIISIINSVPFKNDGDTDALAEMLLVSARLGGLEAHLGAIQMNILEIASRSIKKSFFDRLRIKKRNTEGRSWQSLIPEIEREIRTASPNLQQKAIISLIADGLRRKGIERSDSAIASARLRSAKASESQV